MPRWTCQGDLSLKGTTHGLGSAASTPPWLLQERRTLAKGDSLAKCLEKMCNGLGGLLSGSPGSMLTGRDTLHQHMGSTGRPDAALATTAAACAATGAAVDLVAASEIKQLRQKQMADIQVRCPQGGSEFWATQSQCKQQG